MDLHVSTRQTQTQKLSHRMIQSVSILQMTSQELREYVEELSYENPAMDVVEKPKESIEAKTWDIRVSEESHYLSQRRNNDDDYDPKDTWNFNTDKGQTLKEYLWEQIVSRRWSKNERRIIDFMLDDLDGRGYLSLSTEDIASILGEKPEAVERMLEVLQSLEPAGVCARGLRECLKLQLMRRGELTGVLKGIIEENLELVAKRKYPAIAQKFGITRAEAAACCEKIAALDPRPGSCFNTNDDVRYIVPDVRVVKDEKGYEIILNDAVCPEITINPYYENMLHETDNAEAQAYLKERIEQVKWLKKCMAQRNQTLLHLTEYLLEKQAGFFEEGPEALKPLMMREAADALGVHDSTISRTANRKFLQCGWGVYPISFFFSRSVQPSSGGGFRVQGAESFTSADAKRAIRELVEKEDKKKPLSDRAISEALSERGMTVSRRTVAKYREEENIPDTRGRKAY